MGGYLLAHRNIADNPGKGRKPHHAMVHPQVHLLLSAPVPFCPRLSPPGRKGVRRGRRIPGKEPPQLARQARDGLASPAGLEPAACGLGSVEAGDSGDG